MWRFSMPVRSRIHSSVVSTIFSKSLFVSTRLGIETPVPVIIEKGFLLKILLLFGQAMK